MSEREAPVPADLSSAPGAPVPADSPRIVDLVFAPGRAAPRRRLPAALIAGLAHLALGVWIVGMQPSLEAWSADLASRIHDELTRVEIVELAPPKPPEPSPVAAPPALAPDTTPSATPPPSEPAPRVRLKVGAAPARADAPKVLPIFGIFYWANGMPWHAGHGETQGQGGYPDLWTPAATGPAYAPSPLLADDFGAAGHRFTELLQILVISDLFRTVAEEEIDP